MVWYVFNYEDPDVDPVRSSTDVIAQNTAEPDDNPGAVVLTRTPTPTPTLSPTPTATFEFTGTFLQPTLKATRTPTPSPTATPTQTPTTTPTPNADTNPSDGIFLWNRYRWRYPFSDSRRKICAA